MRHALIICFKDLRQRLRDRTAIITAVVAPLALTLLMGSALGGSQGGGSGMRLCVADLDHSELSRAFDAFVQRPSLQGKIQVKAVDSVSAAETMIRDHDAECAVVMRAGFAEAIKRGDPQPAEILAARGEQFAMLATRGLLRDFMNRAALPADHRRIKMIPVSAGGHLRVVDFFAASMTVLFLNFGVLSGVRALQAEVDSRTIFRLIASPSRSWAIFAGKFAALMLIGLLQMGTMIAATSILFGTRWGNPLPALALVFTSVLMAIGMTGFLMSLADNAEQGTALAAIVIVLLSIVGGQFLPPEGLPDVFETLTRLTPNGQAFFGFLDLSAAGAHGSLLTIAEPLAFTAIVGLSGIAFAGLRARGALQRMT
ncbi:MAG TPA: ABC transporter permease [Candidatus Binataceae bacterium]|nr:ABC transporter permease [Candidatus Binataceae bacterium]